MALTSSRQKIPKSLREATKSPGYYEGINYHYTLLKTTTSINTHDIKGFAADQSHLAVIKRKKFNIKGDFIFVDPDTEKFYSVHKPLATEDNIAIYEIKETSIFEIMTDFELRFKSIREEPMNIKSDNTQSQAESITKEYNYQWDKTKNVPEYKNIGNTAIQYGYGISTKIILEASLTFKGFSDVKFIGTAEFEAFLGGGVKIPDNTEIKFDDQEYNSDKFKIPGIGKSFSFFGVKIAFGAFFNIDLKLMDMVINIPVGFNYFIGYKAHAMKYFEITPNTFIDNEWKLDLIPLSNENQKVLKNLEDTITSASFEATLKLIPMISFDINITSLKLNAKVGLGIPIQMKISFDKETCSFPYLKAKVDIPFSMLFYFPEIKILGKVIIEEIDNEITLDKLKVDFSPVCISQDLFKEAEPDQDPDKIDYTTISLTENSKDYTYTWKSGENERYFKVNVPDLCNENYLFFVTEKGTVHFEAESNTIPKNDMNGYAFDYDFVKVTGNTVTFLLKKKLPKWTDAIIHFYFVYVEDGNVPIAKYTDLNEFHFKNGLYTPLLFPLAGNRIQGVSDKPGMGIPAQYTVREDLVLLFLSLTDSDEAHLALTYSRIGDKEPYLNYDLSNVAKIYEIAAPGSIKEDYFLFYIFCDNAKSVELKQNGKVLYTAIEERQEGEKDDTAMKGRFIFKLPITLKGKITFVPVCKDETGMMCQLTYKALDVSGYYLIRYPSLDGISTTGSGFYVEAIKLNAEQSFNYYKTYKESIQTISGYSDDPIVVNPKYETLPTKSSFKRVCLYDDETKNIIPFSRKYYTENLNDLLTQLNLKVPENDYSGISSDENGCVVFPASLLPSEDAKIYLTKEVSDIPIVPIERPDIDIKYVCICENESLCSECTKGIESNEVETGSSISSDPGDGIEIRVYSETKLSSSIFTKNHKVIVDPRFNLVLTNVEKIDLSDLNAIKYDNLAFSSGDNVFAQPKSSQLSFNFPETENKLNVNIDLPDSFTDKLKLVVSNKGESKVGSNLFIRGKGEVNTLDYPYEKITFDTKVRGFKGVTIVCVPDEKGETCKHDSLDDYKVLSSIEKVETKFEKYVKVYFYLHTFNTTYFDVEINKFDGQDLILVESSSVSLLSEPAKLRILSTTELLNSNNNAKISGSQGSVTFDHKYVNNLVVGFNDKLTIKQDEDLNGKKPKINLQAQSENAVIVIDDSVKVENSEFNLDSEKENAKVTIYYGDKSKEEIDGLISGNEKVEVETQPGKPEEPEEPKGKGSNKGVIIGVVVAVVVVVIVVVVVLVYIFVIRKKKHNESSNENDEEQKANEV